MSTQPGATTSPSASSSRAPALVDRARRLGDAALVDGDVGRHRRRPRPVDHGPPRITSSCIGPLPHVLWTPRDRMASVSVHRSCRGLTGRSSFRRSRGPPVPWRRDRAPDERAAVRAGQAQGAGAPRRAPSGRSSASTPRARCSPGSASSSCSTRARSTSSTCSPATAPTTAACSSGPTPTASSPAGAPSTAARSSSSARTSPSSAAPSARCSPRRSTR